MRFLHGLFIVSVMLNAVKHDTRTETEIEILEYALTPAF